MANASGASAEALPLPKGGGSTRGLGDGFTPDLNRGTGSYAVEIQVPKGFRSLTPRLVLTYNTANGDGPFGYGWNLPLPRVQIDTDTGVANYFAPKYLMDGETLAAIGNGVFRPLVENAFQRIRKTGDQWEVTDKGGNTSVLGGTPESRVSGEVLGATRTFAWLVSSIRDTSGNEIRFTYFRDGGNLYLETVTYAAFEVRLEYEPRPDPTVNRRAGFPVTQALRCRTVSVRRADDPLVIRQYRLEYTGGLSPSLLASVSMHGSKRQPDGSISEVDGPPVEFTYSPFDPQRRRLRKIFEGLPDRPGPLGEDGREIVDLNGDALPDIVQLGAGRPRLWRNSGDGRFAPPVTLTDFPQPMEISASTLLFDADGRGTVDVVELEPAFARYYPNNGAGAFERPRFLGGKQPLSFSLGNPDTAFADINGDGRVDLVQTTSAGLLTWENRGGENGFSLPRFTPRSGGRDALPDVRLSEPGVFVTDMTGDGLPDIVHVASGLVEYWPSLGGGRYDRRQSMANPPQLPRNANIKRVFLADVDGTGTSDVVYVGPDSVTVWRNLGGARFADPVEVKGTPETPLESLRLADLLGTGNAGVLWSEVRAAQDPGYRFLPFTEIKPFLLTHINEGTGAEVRIDYGVSSQHAVRDRKNGEPWRTALPIAVPVVDRITRHDLVTGAADSSEIFYHDGRWDPSVRRFRGFGRVTVKRSGDVEIQEVFEEYRYLVGAPGEPDIDGATGLASEQLDRARRGQMYLSTFFSAGPGSSAVRSEETRWRVIISATAADDTPLLFPQVIGTEVRNLEGGNHPRVVATEYRYDALGNVTRERRSAMAPNGGDDGLSVSPIAVVTETEYATNLDSYVVDRMARVVRRDDSGAVLGEVRHYYDGPDLSGLPLGIAGAGLLRRQEEIVLTRAEATALYGAREPDWTTLGYHDATRIDGAPSIAVNHTRYDYSAHGTIARRVDAFGGETRFDYDPDGLLVVRMTNAVGHVRTASYDRAWQLMEEHTYSNGAAIRYRYDGLGRLRATIQPDDTADLPTIRYTPDHTSIPTSLKTERRKASGAADTYDEVVYFDGQGREVQRRTRIEGDRVRVSGIVRLNRRGDPVFKGQPQFGTALDYQAPETLPGTPGSRYEYDAVGRLVSAFNPENRKCVVVYTPWTATISDVIDTDPADPRRNTPRIQEFDGFGRISGVTLIGEGASRNRAGYVHDLMGRLVASTDLAGRPALRAIRYDGRGLRLRIDHAAAGLRTAIYDARSRLVAYWDARNRIVERTYDAIGRILTESMDGTVQETYHYDLAPNQMGRLGRVEDNAGPVVFSYDALGRVTGKARTVLGQRFDIGYEYEPTGLQRRITYPDGSVAAFDRGGDGRVRRVSGFIDEVGYDGAGRLSRMMHANGIEETFGYTDAGHLATLRFSGAGGTLYDSALVHDAAGRLTGVTGTSGPGPFDETYEHNALGQLTRFARHQGAATTAWEYETDVDGNLLKMGETQTAQFEYDFGATGALSRRTLDNATVETFAFDNAGHMTDWGASVLEWDARGRLVRMTKPDGTVAEMVYDYRGARVAKRITAGAGSTLTRYIDELYEDRAGVGNGYVFAAGRLAGRFRGGGKRHLHVDHRGSVILVTRDDGSVDGRGWFGPYGSVGSVGGAPETADADGSRQMGGLIFDSEIGLYYCNHRYYAPALGRFLSPDPRYLGQPERELDVPEAHNLYVYAAGNPVDYVDPTGESFWSTLGQILAGIVVVIAVVAAIIVVAWLISTAGWLMLAGAAIGAVIGLATDGWEGAALGAMMGATIGINVAIGGPLGIITFMGVFPGIRKQEWYHSLAGWSSWFMPASWPGHIMGLGVFLANGIAHVFGSDNKIESIKFDWKHGQILTAGGEYGGTPFPWLGMSGPSHSLGGFAFWSNSTWEEGGKSWKGIEETVDPGRGFAHETGHMLSNAQFGFWQGIVNGIENLTTKNHDDRLFEKIAQSNVPAGDRDPGDQVIPIWT